VKVPTTASIVGGLILLSCLAAGGSANAGDVDSLPYTLSIQLEYGEIAGPASLLDEVLRLTHHHIESKEWFEDVRALEGDSTPDSDLLLLVRMDDYREETVYETSMAQRQEADDPTSKQRYQVTFDVVVRMWLIHVPGDEVVRTRRFRVQFSRSPEFFGEDLENAIRADAVREIASGIRRVTSKGNLAKLGRKIESLRASPPPASR
jgi:hypothetical protein